MLNSNCRASEYLIKPLSSLALVVACGETDKPEVEEEVLDTVVAVFDLYGDKYFSDEDCDDNSSAIFPMQKNSAMASTTIAMVKLRRVLSTVYLVHNADELILDASAAEPMFPLGSIVSMVYPLNKKNHHERMQSTLVL